MLKSFKYRIYPTKAQITKLNFTLEQCRLLWNHLLENKKLSWERDQINISLYNQQNTFLLLKVKHPSLKLVHSQVLQNVGERLDLAFKAFFRRVKKKENPGYPRFRSYNRYDSFCYPQSGFKLNEAKDKIFLSKIGYIPIILHRSVEGTIKRCTVKCTPTGKWFISFSCKIDCEIPIVPLKNIVGIDVGIKSFATFSDGSQIKNPKFFKLDKSVLAKAQHKRQKRATAHIYERIRNRRDNFSHQLSRKLVNKYDIICIEDLNINQLKENSFRVLNREISDAAWTSFIDKLSYKAEYAGKKVIKVNPAYTSQDCSQCGYRVQKKLSNRIHKCPICKLEIDRDYNAALNILALGLQSIASA